MNWPSLYEFFNNLSWILWAVSACIYLATIRLGLTTKKYHIVAIVILASEPLMQLLSSFYILIKPHVLEQVMLPLWYYTWTVIYGLNIYFIMRFVDGKNGGYPPYVSAPILAYSIGVIVQAVRAAERIDWGTNYFVDIYPVAINTINLMLVFIIAMPICMYSWHQLKLTKLGRIL